VKPAAGSTSRAATSAHRSGHVTDARADAPHADDAPPPPRRPASHRDNDAAPRKRLEDFIVGPCNQLAYSAAMQIIEDDIAAPNPLFIHGGVGLGKTHLLQGVCRAYAQRHPNARVRYTTAEQFTNEYILSVRTNQIERFRESVRELDLLAVDDVRFFATNAKDKTRDEFLHTFDAVDLSGARIVLASDCHPRLIKPFNEALRSRCVSGMVCPITPPDPATRIRIIEALARRRGLCMMETVVAVVAKHCQGSVREMEGTLHRLKALAALMDTNGADGDQPASAGRDAVIGHAAVNRLLHADAAATTPIRPLRLEAILDAVAELTAVPAPSIVGRSRRRDITNARALVVHLARKLTRMSYPQIAESLGQSSHTSAMHADKRVRQRAEAGETMVLPETLEEVVFTDVIDRLERAVRHG
jgi:chromosomal replication initiator protein